LTIPTFDELGERQLFSDSFVAGAANPMGSRHSSGVTVTSRACKSRSAKRSRRARRAHGGVVAALLDEVMGLMNVIHGAMAFTVQLDITYLAPTPVGEPIVARAWLSRQDNRKQFVEATLHAGELVVASAKALFISIDRTTFLQQLLTDEE